MTENDGSDIRGLLFDYIKKNPGSSFKVLQSAFRMSEGNLRYHLQYLERKKRIVFEKDGRDRCYFTMARNRSPFSNEVELSPSQERLLEIVHQNPGITVQEVRSRSGGKGPSFDYDLRRLRENGLIVRVKRGGSVGYEAMTRERTEDELFLEMVRRFTEGRLSKAELMEMVSRLERSRSRGDR